jgi:hypothetical protein
VSVCFHPEKSASDDRRCGAASRIPPWEIPHARRAELHGSRVAPIVPPAPGVLSGSTEQTLREWRF